MWTQNASIGEQPSNNRTMRHIGLDVTDEDYSWWKVEESIVAWLLRYPEIISP